MRRTFERNLYFEAFQVFAGELLASVLGHDGGAHCDKNVRRTLDEQLVGRLSVVLFLLLGDHQVVLALRIEGNLEHRLNLTFKMCAASK